MIRFEPKYNALLNEMMEDFGLTCNVCAFSGVDPAPKAVAIVVASNTAGTSGTLMLLCESCHTDAIELNLQRN